MKKVKIEIIGWYYDMQVQPMDEKDLSDYPKQASDFNFYSYDDGYFGLTEIKKISVKVDGKTRNYTEFTDGIEGLPDTWKYVEKEDKALVNKAIKAGKYEKDEIEDELVSIFYNAFCYPGLREQYKDGQLLAIKSEDPDAKCILTYEFEIPDDERFDISELQIVEIEDGLFYESAFHFVTERIKYGDLIIPLKDLDDDGGFDITYRVGRFRKTDAGCWIDYIKPKV